MKLKRTKKGFTIIELVIVIAVIGILAAVLIPTFVNLTNKANEAADESLVKNLNTALKMEEQTEGHQKSPTLQGAIDDLEKEGFLLENLVAKSGKDLLWNQETNEFELNKNGDKKGLKYWKIVDQVPAPKNQKFSYYAGRNFNPDVPDLKYGFDAGKNVNINNINYVGSDEDNQKVNIRTNGGTFVVNANDHVEHYGISLTVNVVKVSNTTYVEHGSVANLNIAATAPKVEIKQTAFVTNYKNENSNLDIVNKGYVVNVVSEAKTGEGAVTPSTGDIKVYTFDQLQSLALASAIGTSINGKTIQLQNDIDMNEKAWIPFGFDFENAYSGTIDGNGKTIRGMKYTYTEQIETFKSTSEEGTPYGLISYGAGNITIKNLTIEANLSDALSGGEGIACFLGVYNNLINSNTQTQPYQLTFDHCTAKGEVAGKTKVAGFVGTGFITQSTDPNSFAYKKVGQYNHRANVDVKFDHCVNEANVKAQRNGGVKAGGFAGSLALFTKQDSASIGGGSLTIINCTNKGNVEANSGTTNKYVAYGPFCGYLAGNNTVAVDHSTFVDEAQLDVQEIRNTNNGSKGYYLDSGITW